MTVFAGIAEFERALIRERTGSGRELFGSTQLHPSLLSGSKRLRKEYRS